ncbi:MAG: hypothetical protein AAF360_15935 [Pseudomonadota bacterium]
MTVPVSEIGARYPIVATRMDGERLDPFDKGPLWVVYPFDMSDAYRTAYTRARSISMLAEIEAY